MLPSSSVSGNLRPARQLCDLGERGWLRLVREWFETETAHQTVPIGDDAAALDLQDMNGSLVVSTDTMIEGVHFRHDWIGARDLGARALAVNLSDLAAMGARPVAAFLALSVPRETPLKQLKEFFMGFREEGHAYGCPLAGGDLTRAPQWTICVTVLGRPARDRRLARRSGARPGQLLYVTGWPGESGAGLAALEHGTSASQLLKRHRRPTPRLREAEALVNLCHDLAMIDVSDGIWNDTDQLAEASGVRIELNGPAVPVSTPMERLAGQLKIDPEQWTLFGGEDYELLFTTRASLEAIQDAFQQNGLMTPVHCIGHVTDGRGVHLMDEHGHERPVEDRTFRHF